MYACVTQTQCACVDAQMLQRTCGGQRTTVWSQLSPFTFTWAPGIELGLSGFSGKHLSHWASLQHKPCFSFHKTLKPVFSVCVVYHQVIECNFLNLTHRTFVVFSFLIFRHIFVYYYIIIIIIFTFVSLIPGKDSWDQWLASQHVRVSIPCCMLVPASWACG